MKERMSVWFHAHYKNWLIVSLIAIVITISSQLYWGHKEVFGIVLPIIGGAIAMGLILGGIAHLVVSIHAYLTRKK